MNQVAFIVGVKSTHWTQLLTGMAQDWSSVTQFGVSQWNCARVWLAAPLEMYLAQHGDVRGETAGYFCPYYFSIFFSILGF